MKLLQPKTLIVELDESEAKTGSGIVLPEVTSIYWDKHKWTGTVEATGPGCSLKKGDSVEVKSYEMHDDERDPVIRLLLHEDDVLLIN